MNACFCGYSGEEKSLQRFHDNFDIFCRDEYAELKPEKYGQISSVLIIVN